MGRIISMPKKPLNGKRDYRPRRVWTLQQKLELLAKANSPGSSASAVAREHDIDIRLIFQWRRDHKEGMLAQRTWGQPGKRKKKNPDSVHATITMPDDVP
jgi:transposase-like protein